MKINPKYGDKIINIPESGVLEYLPQATCEELRVLIFALANQNAAMEKYISGTGLGRDEISRALNLWRSKGVFSCSGLKGAAANEESEKKRIAEKTEEKKAPDNKRASLLSSELPYYSSEQINRLLEKNRETKSLIDNCQQALGKVFSIHEVESILKLKDYLKLDEDFILLLCSHCAKAKKTSLRYVEKTAVSLFDEGITEYAQLEAYIEDMRTAHGMEASLRKLLGIGERSLTKKESETFLRWVRLGFSEEVIEKAFEVTAENTKKFSLNYMSAVLESWYKDGLHSAEDVERAGREYRIEKEKKKSAETKGRGSFETDDFFDEALKRSYDN